jgi:hypothetical protein
MSLTLLNDTSPFNFIMLPTGEGSTAGMKRKDHPPMREGALPETKGDGGNHNSDDCIVHQQKMLPKGNQPLLDLSSALKAAMDLCSAPTVTNEKIVDAGVEESLVDWKLVSPPSLCVAKWWRYNKHFYLFHDLNMKKQATCTLCFGQRQFA